MVRASIGDLASVAGGGKFGNGAVTAAFSYLITPRYGIDLEQGTEVALFALCMGIDVERCS